MRNLIWQNNVSDTLIDIVDMTVSDAVQHAFDVLNVDNPSSHTRSKLETWLTAERADYNGFWTYVNLLTLVMLSPEFNLA